MISSQRIYILQKLILFSWQWGLRPLNVCRKLLSKSGQSETELPITDRLGQIAVYHAEDLEILLEDQSFQKA